MKFILLLIVLSLIISCGNSPNSNIEQNNNISPISAQNITTKYEPLSLTIDGKQLDILGKDIENARRYIDYGLDPNGEFQDKPKLGKDYFTVSNKLFVWVEEGSLNGISFLAEDPQTKQIFKVSANWLFDLDVTEKSKPKIIEAITKSFFPVLKGKLEIKEGWNYTIDKGNYEEKFELDYSKGEEFPRWVLRYEIKLK